MEILKRIFPNSTVNLHPQRKNSIFVILYDNKVVFDRKKGDGYLNPNSLKILLARLTKMIINNEVNN